MPASFTAQLVMIATVTYIISFLFFRLMRERAKERARREKEAVDRKTQQVRDRQENVGNRIYNALAAAAADNQGSPIKVQRIKDNGGGYSIYVGWEDKTCYTLGGLDYRGYPIVQVNVDITDQSIVASYGPYPNPDNGTCKAYGATDNDVADLIRDVGQHVRTYSPFKVS